MLGPDARDGNHPQGNLIDGNFFHEIGHFQKQVCPGIISLFVVRVDNTHVDRVWFGPCQCATWLKWQPVRRNLFLLMNFGCVIVRLLLCAASTAYQVSCYFQAQTMNSTLTNNICFNGPRAGINFNDGMGGGHFLKVMKPKIKATPVEFCCVCVFGRGVPSTPSIVAQLSEFGG